MVDVAEVPCHGCRRNVKVPSGPLRSALREGKTKVYFCSRRCEKRFIAREGTKKQQEIPNA